VAKEKKLKIQKIILHPGPTSTEWLIRKLLGPCPAVGVVVDGQTLEGRLVATDNRHEGTNYFFGTVRFELPKKEGEKTEHRDVKVTIFWDGEVRLKNKKKRPALS